MATKGRILVIEDDVTWQNKLRDYLEDPSYNGDSYKVEVVGSYAQAVDELTKAREYGRPFLVVIADLKLPESNHKPALSREHGKNLLKLLARNYPDISLVIISGETLSQQELYEFFPLKVSHFFGKTPFDWQAFRGTIDNLVTQARQKMWSLPNHPVIRDQMASLISDARQDENWVILGIGLKHLEYIIERYGFVHCAATLYWVGELLAGIVDEVAPLDFVSLVPFADFIIITASDKVEALQKRILQEFNQKVKAIAYSTFELERSEDSTLPEISLVFGCVSKEDLYRQDIPDIPSIAKEISSAIAKAKRAEGS